MLNNSSVGSPWTGPATVSKTHSRINFVIELGILVSTCFGVYSNGNLIRKIYQKRNIRFISQILFVNNACSSLMASLVGFLRACVFFVIFAFSLAPQVIARQLLAAGTLFWFSIFCWGLFVTSIDRIVITYRISRNLHNITKYLERSLKASLLLFFAVWGVGLAIPTTFVALIVISASNDTDGSFSLEKNEANLISMVFVVTVNLSVLVIIAIGMHWTTQRGKGIISKINENERGYHVQIKAMLAHVVVSNKILSDLTKLLTLVNSLYSSLIISVAAFASLVPETFEANQYLIEIYFQNVQQFLFSLVCAIHGPICARQLAKIRHESTFIEPAKINKRVVHDVPISKIELDPREVEEQKKESVTRHHLRVPDDSSQTIQGSQHSGLTMEGSKDNRKKAKPDGLVRIEEIEILESGGKNILNPEGLISPIQRLNPSPNSKGTESIKNRGLKGGELSTDDVITLF